jgi:hypothetical protein
MFLTVDYLVGTTMESDTVPVRYLGFFCRFENE